MNRTNIEWTDYTWNPLTGCDGCEIKEDCYARRLSHRLKGRYGYPNDDPFRPTFHPERLTEPSHVKQPAKIFVCSMGELFSKQLTEWMHDRIMDVIRMNPQHIFQILTKQPQRIYQMRYPENVWMGISATHQDLLESRMHWLHKADVAVKFLSIEPLTAHIVAIPWVPDWIIVGGLTGPHAQKAPYTAVKRLVDYARNEGIPIFVKDNARYPDHIQEFPTKGGSP